MATLVVCHVFINELLPLAFILKLGVGQLVRSSCSSFSNISFFHCPDLHCYLHRRRLPNIELFFLQYPLPELVVIHQLQQTLDDVLSLEDYIKQVHIDRIPRTLLFTLLVVFSNNRI